MTQCQKMEYSLGENWVKTSVIDTLKSYSDLYTGHKNAQPGLNERLQCHLLNDTTDTMVKN